MSYRNRHKNRQNNHLNQDNGLEHREHIVLPEVDVPKIKEPRPVCEICNEPIEAIIEAISEPNGGYSHFDCVVEKLKKQYHVSENEKLSYVGQGNFAVFTTNEEGAFVIKEKISYESVSQLEKMKSIVEDAKHE